MALYLGSEKVKINLDGVVYCLNLFSETAVIGSGSMSSSDDYILKDSNGLYLIPKDYVVINGTTLSTSDNYILKDSNGLYLTIKENK